MEFHIAQANVSYLRKPISDPLIADFVGWLDEINRLAEVSPGFVWRFISDSRNPEHQVFDDPMILFNMTVWEDIQSLHAFTYRTTHAEVFAGRKKWFEEWKDVVGGSSFALWWIPARHLPTAEEAKLRLELIRERGPNAEAFTFKQAFPMPAE